jgi:hypothetical protein
MQRGQVLVPIAKVILPELTGGVALCSEGSGDCRRLRWHADGGSCLTHSCETRADRQLTRYEISASCCAARLGIIVGEDHAFGGHSVEIRGPPGHHAAMISADIEPTDVVGHNKYDVRLALVGHFDLLPVVCRN